jgi:hypothetical protein
MTIAAMSGVVTPLITALTTGIGDALAIPSSFKNHNFMITAAAGTTSGAVQIETSNDSADSGTWSPLTASPTTVVASADVLIAYTGLLNFVRTRISTTIAGGGAPSVTVTYEGAKSY